MEDINKYQGVKILCKKDIVTKDFNKSYIIYQKGKFYKLNIIGLGLRPIIVENESIQEYFTIDEFYEHFQLKTKHDVRKEKISKLLDGI